MNSFCCFVLNTKTYKILPYFKYQFLNNMASKKINFIAFSSRIAKTHSSPELSNSNPIKQIYFLHIYLVKYEVFYELVFTLKVLLVFVLRTSVSACIFHWEKLAVYQIELDAK